MKPHLLLVLMAAAAFPLHGSTGQPAGGAGDPVGNPALPGNFADPSMVIHEGRLYLYATRDPWGGDSLACFSTTDFKSWREHPLNWPTREACTSGTGNDNKVWAPSVARDPAGGYVMYVSVGSEIYCGRAEHPTGPWENVRGDGGPLIAHREGAKIHAIDAEVFIDGDGAGYLFWGSGWNWEDGVCMGVRLEKDLHSFAGEPVEVTPPGYFEAPFMIRRGDRYYLMYSDGKTIDDTYKVRYAVADSPLGPFDTEGPNSPILQTDPEREVFGPGHHAVFRLADDWFIAYHRHSRPFQTETLLREICFDRLEFDDDGSILAVTPTDTGIRLPPAALGGTVINGE